MKIYPSLISADLLNLAVEIKKLDPYVDGYHLDIMDNHFVPNLTWGPAFIEAIASATKLPLHIHAMVTKPLSWLNKLNLRNNDCFVFHYEALSSEQEGNAILQQLKAKNIAVGIAINPRTPATTLHHYLPHLDNILIMSVEPGFSGQTFINVLDKITFFDKERKKNNYSYSIALDGGINTATMPLITKENVDILCVASALFKNGNVLDNLQRLKEFL